MSQSHKGVDCLKLLCAVGRGLKVASVTLAWRKPRALVDLPPFPSRSAICDSDAKISRRHTDRYTMYGERGLRSASDCVLHMASAIGSLVRSPIRMCLSMNVFGHNVILGLQATSDQLKCICIRLLCQLMYDLCEHITGYLQPQPIGLNLLPGRALVFCFNALEAVPLAFA